MIFIKSGVQVECNVCKKTYNIEPDIECVDSNYRNLGTETFYESFDEFVCSECGTQLVVSAQIWEYPENVINDIVYDCINAKIVKEMIVEFRD